MTETKGKIESISIDGKDFKVVGDDSTFDNSMVGTKVRAKMDFTVYLSLHGAILKMVDVSEGDYMTLTTHGGQHAIHDKTGVVFDTREFERLLMVQS